MESSETKQYSLTNIVKNVVTQGMGALFVGTFFGHPSKKKSGYSMAMTNTRQFKEQSLFPKKFSLLYYLALPLMAIYGCLTGCFIVKFSRFSKPDSYRKAENGVYIWQMQLEFYQLFLYYLVYVIKKLFFLDDVNNDRIWNYWESTTRIFLWPLYLCYTHLLYFFFSYPKHVKSEGNLTR